MAKKTEAKKTEVKKGGAKKSEKELLVITQEIFDTNAFLADEGVNVGDQIEFTKELKGKIVLPAEEKPEPKVGAVKAPKITCPVSILNRVDAEGKSGEYVRTYEKGQEAEAISFLGKDANYKAVDPESIVSITVSYRENEIKKDSDTGRMLDTGKVLNRAVLFTESKDGAEWMKKAITLAHAGPRRACVAKLG